MSHSDKIRRLIHDIRTPLNTLQVSLRGLKPGSGQEELLGICLQSLSKIEARLQKELAELPSSASE
ncbi:MAG: hypothetical protein ACFB9M_16370 [Myxococcota bacterium]